MLGTTKTELIRKSVHTAGLLAIPMLYYSQRLVVGIIVFFLMLYPFIEVGLAKGFNVPLLSQLTHYSKRPHEHNVGFAWAAYFIAMGYLFSVALFPRNIACVAILHTSAGDTAAALAGQQWGRVKLFYNPSKSWVGAGAYLAVTFLGGLFFLSPGTSLLLAVLGSVVESLPLKNMDNLLIPVTISLGANFLV